MKTDSSFKQIWTIAGSDCSAGAGIQADLKTAQALGVECATVITALTAQNASGVRLTQAVDPTMILQQIRALLPAPSTVKIGMLYNAETVSAVAETLTSLNSYIICDPVICSSSGTPLLDHEGVMAMKQKLFPHCDLITPNIPEAEQLTGHSIQNHTDITHAANQLLKMGPTAVLIKGGHATDSFCCDYFSTTDTHCWINSKRQKTPPVHGTGCSLSAATAAGVALGYAPLDAIVLAKAYLNRGLRTAYRNEGTATLLHEGWPDCPNDLPWITDDTNTMRYATPFPSCGTSPIGLYPLVDSLEQVKRLTDLHVPTLQLRLKETDAQTVEQTIQEAIQITTDSATRLFINDYWQLAIKHGAYGVHLGQEDLKQADLAAIHDAGLRLGTSTHSFSELARINTWRPSYVAMGTVFPSPSKPGLTQHLGLTTLKHMVQLAEMPAVAIGGILLDNAEAVAATGINGIAVISAIRNAQNLPAQVDSWQKIFNKDS